MSTNWIMVQKGHGRGGSVYSEYYTQPVIGITPKSELLLTPFLHEQLGKPRFVHIYHDAQTQKIGVEAAAEGDRNSFTVRGFSHDKEGNIKATNKSMLRISCPQLLRNSGLIIEGMVSLIRAEVNEDSGMLVSLTNQSKMVVPYISRPRRNHNGKSKKA